MPARLVLNKRSKHQAICLCACRLLCPAILRRHDCLLPLTYPNPILSYSHPPMVSKSNNLHYHRHHMPAAQQYVTVPTLNVCKFRRWCSLFWCIYLYYIHVACTTLASIQEKPNKSISGDFKLTIDRFHIMFLCSVCVCLIKASISSIFIGGVRRDKKKKILIFVCVFYY